MIELREWEIVKCEYAGSCKENNYLYIFHNLNHIIYITFVTKQLFRRSHPSFVYLVANNILLKVTFVITNFSN